MFFVIRTEQSIIKTNSYGKVLGPTSIQWEEAMELPCLYSFDMPFEIYEKHEFGYNPEEIDKVLHGTIHFIQSN